MTTVNTGQANFGGLVQRAMQQEIEGALRAKLVFLTPGSYMSPIRSPGTSAMVFTAISDLTGTINTLSEGVSPTPLGMPLDWELVSPTQCGNVVELTDRSTILSPLDLISAATEKLARLAAEEANLIAKAAFETCNNIAYINGSTSSAVSATMTGAPAKLMFAKLQNTNVPTFDDGLYRAVCSPRTIYDLQTDTATGGWMDVTKYASPDTILANEVGQYAGIRWMASTIQTVGTTAASGGKDLLTSYFFGPGAIGFGGLTETQTYFTGFTADKADPIGQLAYVGYKSYLGAAYLAKAGNKMIALRHCGTILNAATEH